MARIFLVFMAAAIMAWAKVAVADPAPCDVLAAADHDPLRPDAVAPVSWEVLVAQAKQAVRACEVAVDMHGDEPRVVYQLGRALDAAGRADDALKFYQRAAALEYPAALADLAGHYATARAVPENFARAFRLAEVAAGKGDSLGMFWMATLYLNGTGPGQDESEARQWFLQAAEKGSVIAMKSLAQLYAQGIGGDADAKRAQAWAEKAQAADKAIEAALKVAAPPQEVLQRRFEDLLLTAKIGNARSMLMVAQAYATGIGAPENLAEAERWYLAASKAGQPEADLVLGRAYSKGLYGKTDMPAAIRHYFVAAEGRQTEASRFLIGQMQEGDRATKLEIQRELAARKFYRSKLDGQTGPATQEAFQQFLVENF